MCRLRDKCLGGIQSSKHEEGGIKIYVEVKWKKMWFEPPQKVGYRVFSVKINEH